MASLSMQMFSASPSLPGKRTVRIIRKERSTNRPSSARGRGDGANAVGAARADLLESDGDCLDVRYRVHSHARVTGKCSSLVNGGGLR